MPDSSKEQRVRELETLIRHHQDLYYNRMPELSDSEFDRLWDELEDLDPRNSLLSGVGGDSSDGWPKANHKIPMGSQAKVSDPENFLLWAQKTGLQASLVQYKLDGASLEMQYESGILIRAVTRGDGLVGDDITPNARKMRGVLERLDVDFSGGVRGEVLMSRTVHKTKYPDKANCRNAANGLMKRKDGEGSEDLEVICYDASGVIADSSGKIAKPFGTETEKLKWLKARGFMIVESVFCETPMDVIRYRGKMMELRAVLDHDIDGLVVKRDSIDEDDLAKTRPDSQIAFKFSPEEAVTILQAVEWSESGALYTPIGIMDPVRLAGTTVQRANLCNPDMVRAMNLRIGSRIVITKRGEIIPKIESLVENPPGATEIEFPTSCKACGSALVDEGTRLFCPNEHCPKKELHRILKWLATLDIRDFGETLARRLHASGQVKTIADLYSLTLERLKSIERMGSLSATKILRNLHAVKEVPLSTFIAGFDIDRVGPLVAEKLVSAGFGTLETLFAADAEDLLKVPGIASIMADSIIKGLAAVKTEMEEVLAVGAVKIQTVAANSGEDPAARTAAFGKSFCFTGELNNLSRKDAERLVKESGGFARSAVTKELDYLVTEDSSSGSAKNKKASELGIPIIDTAVFLSMLEKRDT